MYMALDTINWGVYPNWCGYERVRRHSPRKEGDGGNLMPAHKRSLVEAKLGESLESFLKRKMAAKQGVTSIAREIGVDHATIKYYIKKWDLFSWRDKVTQPQSRLKDGHVDICLCPLCITKCDEKERTHKLGRCVIVCVSFRRKRYALS